MTYLRYYNGRGLHRSIKLGYQMISLNRLGKTDFRISIEHLFSSEVIHNS